MSQSKAASAALQKAEAQCKHHGTRLTTKRKQVLESLVDSSKALSAYELLDCYKDAFGEALPAMSVYRILEFLEQEQLVHKLNLSNKYVACAHITCDHAHGTPQFLVCGQCNKVKEIHIRDEIVADLKDNVALADFHLAGSQIELNCVCSDCYKH